MANTFAHPLKPKRTDFSYHGVFSANGPREVGDVYRERFGGPPFPITRDPKPQERWFCNSTNCSQWRDESGTYHGQCAGWCCGG